MADRVQNNPHRTPPSRPAHEVVKLDGMVVEGKVIKPEVMYVLSRSESRYQERPFEASFLDEIRKSIKGNPF